MRRNQGLDATEPEPYLPSSLSSASSLRSMISRHSGFNRSLGLLLSLFWILSGTGCSRPDSASSPPRTYTDALGRDVSIRDSVERVVTIAPGVTEIVVAAGAFDRIVGVSNADNFPPGVANLPTFSAIPMDFETVTSLRPDLILATTEVNDPRDAAMFYGLEIPVYYLTNRSLDEVFAAIETVGELLHTKETATAAVDSLRARMHFLARLSNAVHSRPRVLFLISYETLFAFGRDSYVHDLIEIAGGHSITSDHETVAPVLDDEYVLRQSPDVIIGTFGDSFGIDDLLQTHPTWSLVPAVQEGRVYSVENDLILRAGPRIVDGAYRMFELMHGEDAE